MNAHEVGQLLLHRRLFHEGQNWSRRLLLTREAEREHSTTATRLDPLHKDGTSYKHSKTTQCVAYWPEMRNALREISSLSHSRETKVHRSSKGHEGVKLCTSAEDMLGG